MSYLRLRDYNSQIQTVQLNEITGNDPSVRLSAERTAQEEISTYLRQRWDITDEFRDTVVFALNQPYKAKQLVELNFPAYNPAIQYLAASKTMVVNAGSAYMVSTNTPNPAGSFDPTKWTLLGAQYDLFNIPTPYPVFDNGKVYQVGDMVWWKDVVYERTQATDVADHFQELQFGQYEQIPNSNIFPDDPKFGSQFWKAGPTYTFTGLLITNPPASAWVNVTAYTPGNIVSFGGINYVAGAASTGVTPGTDFTIWNACAWVYGDNRNQQLYIYMVNMALYHIYGRISPKNRPEHIETCYHVAKDWLKDAAYGKVMTSITQIQPPSGRRIRSGGNIKNTNTY